MSDKFNGFSEDDINKIALKTIKPVKPSGVRAIGIRRMPEKKEIIKPHDKNVPKTMEKKHNTMSANIPKQSIESLDEINLDKSMSRSIEGALFYQPIPKMEKNSQDSLNDESIIQLPATKNGVSNTSSILDEPSETIESPFKGISLKDFESHRKIIQEQNRQKKEMLHKAIEAHSQKTAAEAKKIEEIKAELAKLDVDLASDVAILRKQIDVACINYAHIEKQYNKIEAQFLKAKMELHNASEKKELLTEHLCTVIAHNEDRKAEKLSELMNKVGLDPLRHLEKNGVHKPAV